MLLNIVQNPSVRAGHGEYTHNVPPRTSRRQVGVQGSVLNSAKTATCA